MAQWQTFLLILHHNRKNVVMKRFFAVCIIALLTTTTMMGKNRNVELRIIETSDVHGSFFPYDFINRRPKDGSLARVYTYVERLRKKYKDNLILLDNGDILQGQPTCYYSNFINTSIPNAAGEIINFMGYDAETVGNHDVETGHAVYDKWKKELKCPLLAANVIKKDANGESYFEPYPIINRQGVKVAVIGMLTPAIPNWLNEKLWKGMEFEEMVSSAKKWVKTVKNKENPDVIIGLFHSGRNGGIHNPNYDEDASMEVAAQVPGFDLILYGHDHTMHVDSIACKDGKNVLCLDPSCDALYVSDATISLTLKGKRVISKQVFGNLYNVKHEEVSKAYMDKFKSIYDSTYNFVNQRIGTFQQAIRLRDAYFGSSAFMDLVHKLQIQITGAQISLSAPLSHDAVIHEGDVRVSDMFNLYRYENQIYAMNLTGKEIKSALEMSYDLWVNTMKNPEDHIMLIAPYANDKQRNGFKNLTFNFDSAAGIDYTVDVTQPNGMKVNIISMADGTPFDESKTYSVAVNSYRGNGGGELLTKGAGIPLDSLPKRVTFASEKDMRYYMIKEIQKEGTLNPVANNNWKFIPEDWAKPALARDRKLLFKD